MKGIKHEIMEDDRITTLKKTKCNNGEKYNVLHWIPFSAVERYATQGWPATALVKNFTYQWQTVTTASYYQHIHSTKSHDVSFIICHITYFVQNAMAAYINVKYIPLNFNFQECINAGATVL